MNQPDTINKVISELEQDFFLSPEFKDRLEYYLALTYGAGFDKGHGSIINAKPVGRYIDGKLESYPSVSEAARAVQIDKSAISKSIQKNRICAGFKWQYL